MSSNLSAVPDDTPAGGKFFAEEGRTACPQFLAADPGSRRF
jgi:hypothetical protein